MSYNEVEVDYDGVRYIFVTRGKTKPVSAEEIVEYLNKKAMQEADKVEEEFKKSLQLPIDFGVKDVLEAKNLGKSVREVVEAKALIPDTKSARNVFQQDLRQGLDFCAAKYGVSKDAIEQEAKRIASLSHG